jgi:hypothetical protein
MTGMASSGNGGVSPSAGSSGVVASAAGGASSGFGGKPNFGGAAGSSRGDGEASGCSCVAGRRYAGGGTWLMALTCLAVGARRRRRSQPS